MDLLFGIGGSDDSWAAFTHIVERAAETGDSLTVAILDNPDSGMASDEIETRVTDTLADHGLDAEIRRIEGDPGPMLVEIANGEDYDRIVLGGGERSPMGKIRVGGIAEFVVLNAETTVTLVR